MAVFRFRRWWLLCGAVLVGVVALNGVVDAKAVAARGSVCVRVGAKALDGVSGRGLVCVQTKVRGLRWLFEPTAVTTTTTATSTSATTTVAVANVAPRVVSASAVTGNAVITIADMSPDTGVYAVQWVPVGQSFNSFSMFRTTTKTMTVPYLSCTRTYTLRVFVMQANWQMTDGFVNQNVTPHSATFDLTMPECSATAAATTTTTTVALTCATGGVCVVGDTGPGGGKVFYVSATNFTSTGSDCNTACKYLEAAPTGWGNGITVAEGETTGSSTVDPKLDWCSDTTTLRNATTKTAIGDGRPNTTTGVTCSTGAIFHAELYVVNGKTDWHLPSKDELNQLFINRATVGGFFAGNYLSSSEGAADAVWGQSFINGFQAGFLKTSSIAVRPVRAFG